MLLPLVSTGVITYVIFMSILIMSFGNMIFNKVDELVTSDSDINLVNSGN